MGYEKLSPRRWAFWKFCDQPAADNAFEPIEVTEPMSLVSSIGTLKLKMVPTYSNVLVSIELALSCWQDTARRSNERLFVKQ